MSTQPALVSENIQAVEVLEGRTPSLQGKLRYG